MRPRSLGYEQAERRRNPSRPIAHTHAGLGRRRHAVSACLTTFGSFRDVLVTITVTRALSNDLTFRFWGGRGVGSGLGVVCLQALTSLAGTAG